MVDFNKALEYQFREVVRTNHVLEAQCQEVVRIIHFLELKVQEVVTVNHFLEVIAQEVVKRYHFLDLNFHGLVDTTLDSYLSFHVMAWLHEFLQERLRSDQSTRWTSMSYKQLQSGIEGLEDL